MRMERRRRQPWKPLFDAAGLDMSTFTPATPQWSPRDFADTRAAWEGPLTGHPDYTVRVEAAAYRGRPTSMLLLGPWSRPTRMAPRSRARRPQIVLSAIVSLLIIALTVAGADAGALQRAGGARRSPRRHAPGDCSCMVGYAVMFVVTATPPDRCERRDRPVHQELRRCPDRCRHVVDRLPGARTVRAALLARRHPRVDAPACRATFAIHAWDGIC